jgi:hypothetical protein
MTPYLMALAASGFQETSAWAASVEAVHEEGDDHAAEQAEHRADGAVDEDAVEVSIDGGLGDGEAAGDEHADQPVAQHLGEEGLEFVRRVLALDQALRFGGREVSAEDVEVGILVGGFLDDHELGAAVGGVIDARAHAALDEFDGVPVDPCLAELRQVLGAGHGLELDQFTGGPGEGAAEEAEERHREDCVVPDAGPLLGLKLTGGHAQGGGGDRVHAAGGLGVLGAQAGVHLGGVDVVPRDDQPLADSGGLSLGVHRRGRF